MKRTVQRILPVLAVAAVVAALCRYWPFVSAFLPGSEAHDFSAPPAPGARPRPANWAVPLEAPPLANFHRVSRELYRGAQPTREGMKRLAAMGIKTVVNLRLTGSDRTRLDGTGLDYEHIHMVALRMSDDDVIRFLRSVTKPARMPVFVHCRHGADRTGAMCAIYRIAVCGWSKADAINEMVNGGFGFNKEFRNLVKYIEEADIEYLKQHASIATTPASTGPATGAIK
ncbi:MAG: tyrosine-protein phosphatase [Phycisphaerae bacterium]|nr:tyrosine-protein phosphatase [Phycisphaerae bacterium]